MLTVTTAFKTYRGAGVNSEHSLVMLELPAFKLFQLVDSQIDCVIASRPFSTSITEVVSMPWVTNRGFHQSKSQKSKSQKQELNMSFPTRAAGFLCLEMLLGRTFEGHRNVADGETPHSTLRIHHFIWLVTNQLARFNRISNPASVRSPTLLSSQHFISNKQAIFVF